MMVPEAAPTPHDVLLVEDNPGDAELIMDLLHSQTARESGTIVHVPTLADAEARLRTPGIAVVLLDLRLPDGDGVECVNAVRGFAHDVPIVVLTGIEDDEVALRCLAAGAQDYLSKGDVRTESLRRAIAYALARTRERMERDRADNLESRFAAIVETSADAIVSTSRDGSVTSWNRGAERIFGMTADEVLGRALSDVVRGPPGEPGALRTGLCDRAESTSEPEEIVRLRKDGTAVTLSVVVSPLRDAAGEPIGDAAICRDVTRQKNMEVQLVMSDQLASLGTLAAGVAHEINNPLAAVIANLTVALQQLPDDDAGRAAREPIDEAAVAAERIRTIVRDLRIFSRSEADVRKPCDVHHVLDSVARMAHNQLRHHAHLVRDFRPVSHVLANESRLSQVFLNLLVNAAQAIPEGHADTNQIRLVTRHDDAGRVLVDVEDTGPGISPEVQRRLFTPFFTTKDVGVGMGLGLAISRRIIEAMGGEISLESTLGHGSRFTVTLPSAATPEVVPAATRTSAPPATRRGRVLVIDDDAVVLRSIQRILGGAHAVVCLESAIAALELLGRGERFDVILCDLMMPTMSGAEFVRALRESDPENAARIVLLTGGAFTPQAHAFLEGENVATMEKPFDVAGLRALIARRLV